MTIDFKSETATCMAPTCSNHLDPPHVEPNYDRSHLGFRVYAFQRWCCSLSQGWKQGGELWQTPESPDAQAVGRCQTKPFTGVAYVAV